MNTATQITAFAGLLKRLESEDQILEFLSALLTPKELDEISNRMAIIQLLREGQSQREVAQQLGVGIATVTRGARVLKTRALEELLLKFDDQS
ncbi:MAG: trp operon repressor [Pseudomonadales bacterium]|nr:trp operon repressor [Pseudomonadales bacterium]